MTRLRSPLVLPGAAGAPFATRERCTIRELLNDPADPASSLAEATVAPGAVTERHALDVDERYVILRGTGRLELDGEGRDLRPGDAALIPAGCAQRIANTGAEDLVFLCLCTPRFTPAGYTPLEESP